MKKLILTLFLVTIATNAFATRTYHPHIKEVSVSFESGDRVTFFTDHNTTSVTGITIISRNNIEYRVPEKEIKDIHAPILETLKITFHENSEHPYEEGSFALSFDHDGSSESPGFIPDAQYFFDDGIFIGDFDNWYAYKKNKEE